MHTLSGFTLLPANFRVFLYGYSGTATFKYLTVTPDDTYNSFVGSTLSSRWTPTALAGSSGTVTAGGGQLQITGAANSRFGVLSQPIADSSTDVTTIDAGLNSISGTNGLFDLYSGTGAGDFANFLEFGVQSGHAVIYTPSGVGNWTGTATVTLPVKLTMEVGTYGPAGRFVYFFVNGAEVHEFDVNTDITAPDYRVFLYGYGATTTTWSYVDVTQVHMFDRTDAGFDPSPSATFGTESGIPNTWAETSLAGGTGSAYDENSQAVVTGVSGSRFGLLSPALDQSDIYGYTVQAKLDAITTSDPTGDGLLDVYAGSGAGDFSHYLEFGVQNGDLVSFGAGLPSWTGAAVSLPVVLRVEVGPWTSSGRDVFFYANGQLVYELIGTAVIPDQPYQTFFYGYGATTTNWDYVTYWKTTDGTWQADGYANQATYAQTTSAYNGDYAEAVAVSQADAGTSGISQDDMPVVAGHQYAVSVYLEQSGLSSPVTVSLGPDTPVQSGYTPYASTTFSGITGSWVKYSATLTPSSSDEQAKLYVGTTGTGTLDIDMVSVMPLNSAEVVDGGWNASFVAALQALHPQAIRWPGGIIADDYNWQNGVGPSDQRPPQFYGQFDAEWMTNDVGTNEILALGQALGIPVILGANLGTGTAAEAADWVQFVNGSTGTTYGAQRAADGYPTPWAVHTWEVGNESWGEWEPGWATEGTGNASTYASDYNSYYTAMTAQDPTIDVLATGGNGNVDDQSWNATVLQAAATAGTTVNALSVHYYSPQNLPVGYSSSDVYNASLGAGVTISSDLDSSINTILANSTFDTKEDVTEYNAMYFNEADDRTRTLEGGLVEGSLENLLLRRPEITSIDTASTLVNFWDGSAIRLGVRGSFVTPGDLIESVINNNYGPLLVPATVTTGTYSAPAMGDLAAQSAVPYLDATATRSADGTKLYLSVVNRDPSNDHQTTIELTAAGTVGSTATYSQVDASSYLAQNTWQAPTAVGIATGTVGSVGSSFTYTFPAHSYTEITIPIGATAVTGPVLVGQVTTASGAPVAGATVTTDTGLNGTTDANGYYRIQDVPQGTYSLTATASGYTSYTQHGIEVSSVGATPLPIRLATP